MKGNFGAIWYGTALLGLALTGMLGCTTAYSARDLGPGFPGAGQRMGLNNSGSVVASGHAQAPNPQQDFVVGAYVQGNAPAPQPYYQVNNAHFGLSSSWGTAINDAGFSVGGGSLASQGGSFRGIVLSGSSGVTPEVLPNGTTVDKVALLQPLPGYRDSQAFDINLLRMIVGVSGLGENGRTSMATLWPGWETSAQPVALGERLPVNFGNFALAVNKNLEVVGYYFEGDHAVAGGKERPWYRSPGTHQQGVPPVEPFVKTLPNVDGRATGINESGWVVGFSNVSGPGTLTRAWVWRPSDGAFQPLTGSADTFAYGINDAGVVVGQTAGHACYWPNLTGSGPALAFGDPIDLNTQIDANPGFHLDAAYQINTAGQILAVGTPAGTPPSSPWPQHLYLLTHR